MPAADPREELDVVNENDEPIATATRREVHEEALLHRAVHVLLTDDDERLLLQRRSMDKRTYPGLWTSSASGHVPSGVPPIGAARREASEELGIDPPAMGPVGTVRVEELDVGEREIVHVFLGSYDGEVDPDPAEVVETGRFEPQTVAGWLEDDPGRLADTFVPVFEHVADRLLERSREA